MPKRGLPRQPACAQVLMYVVLGGQLTKTFTRRRFSWPKYSKPMEYLHREIACCQNWQGSRLTQFYFSMDRQGSPPLCGSIPCTQLYRRPKSCMPGTTPRPFKGRGAQRLVCAIMMLDEALSNKQAAPISPLEKLALTPKNVYDPRKPDAHQ